MNLAVYLKIKWQKRNRSQSEPLFTKADGRASYRKISWNLEAARFIFILFPIALKFNGQLGSSAVELPVKFQSDSIFNVQSRDFETSRDLTIRRPSAQWTEAHVWQDVHWFNVGYSKKVILAVLSNAIFTIYDNL